MISELAELIEVMIEKNEEQIYTSIPVEVISFNPSENTVDVQPTVRLSNGDYYPILSDLPIQQLGAGAWQIQHIIKRGDQGVVHFSMVSLTDYMIKGGVKSVDDHKPPHSMIDGYFVAGLRSSSKSTDTEGFIITDTNGTVSIELTASGILMTTKELKIDASTSVEITGTSNISIGGKDFLTHTHQAGGTLITTATVGTGPIGIISGQTGVVG